MSIARLTSVACLSLLFTACSGPADPDPDGDGRHDELPPGCVAACATGTRACEGAGFKVCAPDAQGCPAWSAVTACAANEYCDTGACRKSCFDGCAEGSALCDAAGVRACRLGTNGCWDWAPPSACPDGEVCSGGACAGSCSDQCAEGTKVCGGNAVLECKRLASGCLDWASPAACAVGTVCSGGACAATCSNQCSAGATRCSAGGRLQSCVTLATGCTEWTLPIPCAAGESCPAAGDRCQASPCRAGEARCAGNDVETCDTAANWLVTQHCPQACDRGACTAVASCSPGAVRCNGDDVEICNSAGTAWLFNQACNVGCGDGVCSDPCESGEKRCNGKTPETCNAAGTGWTAASACATDCFKGECILPDLVVDGITKTMEGEHAFLNGVVVQNGGQIKVGPSGSLIIRARSFSVDAASSVEASGVGDAPGASTSGSTSCYNSGHSGGWIYGTGSAAGGGYGTPSTCTRTIYASDGCSCSATDPDNTSGTSEQIDIAEGAPDYTGSAAGGMFAVYASQLVDVRGSITANGTGQASGGGILLAADSIKLSGPVQAVGSGCGGKGRVKLLHGATLDVTTTIDAAESESVSPPLKLVSGSHPDQQRWYNDGLGDWFIAWDKPFATRNGYYVVHSTNRLDVPSPSHGKFLQQESTVVPAEELAAGANYFHIVAVDSGFQVGTIENVIQAQINGEPPTISSSSHSQEWTWYENPALYLTWTNPKDDANFTGYYYALDHYADTVPGESVGTFTTSKQLLLSSLADGIWVFHLVNRDTRGATTKEAAHFYAFIGAEPAKGNLSGSVFDASNSNAPLSGVSIKINRGVFGVQSTSSGTFTFNNDLYEGTWEVTASKSGYLPQTATVTVAAGQVASRNFTLTKAAP